MHHFRFTKRLFFAVLKEHGVLWLRKLKARIVIGENMKGQIRSNRFAEIVNSTNLKFLSYVNKHSIVIHSHVRQKFLLCNISKIFKI